MSQTKCQDPRHGVSWDANGNPQPCKRCQPPATIKKCRFCEEKKQTHSILVNKRGGGYCRSNVCDSCYDVKIRPYVEGGAK